MSDNNKDIDKVIDLLANATKSPRGKYSASETYKILEKIIFGKNKRLTLYRTIASAAAVAVICLLGWGIYQTQSVNMITVNTSAETKTVKLPDGTDITINHYSSVQYPEKFSKNIRQVSLTGEAYFEVAQNKEKPFVVKAADICVEVLGTHFNIEAYANDKEIKTTLLEGSVAVYDNENTTRVVLEPHQSAIYDKTNKQLLSQPEANALDEIAWKQGILIFNNIPLREITRQLSNYFGVNITIDNENLAQYKMTARFTHKESLDDILLLLKSAGSFEYTRTNEGIILKYKN